MKRCAIVVLAAMGAAVLSAQVGPGAGGGRPGGMGRGQGLGPGLGVVGPWPGASFKPVTGAPYSAVRVSTLDRVLADGNKIHRRDEAKAYRDGQGRERTDAQNVIMIIDPVGGFMYSLNPAKQTALKMAMGPRGAGLRREGPPPARAQEQDLGTQTIDGMPATGKRITHTIPANAIGNQQPIEAVREIWTSTTLKVPLRIKSTDPRSGNYTMELTNIVQGEPDPGLFQVPSNYTVTERGPGAGMRQGMRRRAGANAPR